MLLPRTQQRADVTEKPQKLVNAQGAAINATKAPPGAGEYLRVWTAKIYKFSIWSAGYLRLAQKKGHMHRKRRTLNPFRSKIQASLSISGDSSGIAWR